MTGFFLAEISDKILPPGQSTSHFSLLFIFLHYLWSGV